MTLHTTESDNKVGSTVKYLIDRAYLEENQSKYTQTQRKICTIEPLQSLLGKFGENQFCKEILAGNTVTGQFNSVEHELIKKILFMTCYQVDLLDVVAGKQKFICNRYKCPKTFFMFVSDTGGLNSLKI